MTGNIPVMQYGELSARARVLAAGSSRVLLGITGPPGAGNHPGTRYHR